jgi:hypothetical protein
MRVEPSESTAVHMRDEGGMRKTMRHRDGIAACKSLWVFSSAGAIPDGD